MTNQPHKNYDLEQRTLQFSKDIRGFVKLLPKTVSNKEDVVQLIRSSGSVGANYIEANESLGKKDFVMRVKISKKEARESAYWLQLINVGQETALISQRDCLAQEATELMKIFGAIVSKSV